MSTIRFNRRKLDLYKNRVPLWVSPLNAKRIERHFEIHRPDIQAEVVRAALASVHPSVQKEIWRYIRAHKYHDAETLLLQYVVNEDHTSLIRSAEQPEIKTLRRESRSFELLLYSLAVVFVILLVLFLVPWLIRGRI